MEYPKPTMKTYPSIRGTPTIETQQPQGHPIVAIMGTRTMDSSLMDTRLKIITNEIPPRVTKTPKVSKKSLNNRVVNHETHIMCLLGTATRSTVPFVVRTTIRLLTSAN
ncbi:MAG: hypothetical protein GY696_32000 [Gammaproteobacteria bacterium]|nr:hypothetical protein [Gammaproteobacteria bacterium]